MVIDQPPYIPGTLFRVSNAVMAVVFLVGIGLQLLTPGGGSWTSVLAAAFIACLLGAYGRLHWVLPAFVAVISLIWVVMIWLHVVGVAPLALNVEDFGAAPTLTTVQRAMIRLLIVSFWMIVLTVVEIRRRF